MTLTIGRVGIDIDLTHPSAWTQNGNQVRVSGWLRGYTLDEAKGLRQQLLGYVDSPQWEPEIPLTWSIDDTHDGFYRILDVEVQDVLGISQRNSMYRFNATLERVAKYAAVKAESVLYGALRFNAHNITVSSATAWHAVPATTTGYVLYGGGFSGYTSRSGYGQDLHVYQSNGLFDATAHYRLPPANWYDLSPRFGDLNQVFVGEQTPPADAWLLENMRTRLEYTGSWRLATLHSGVYSGGLTVTPGYRSGSSFLPLTVQAVTPMRQSPVETSVRVELSDPAVTSTAASSVVTLDLSIRRGAQYVEAVFGTLGDTRQFGFELGQAIAGTSTGGSTWGAVTNAAIVGTNHGYSLSPQPLQIASASGQCYLSTAASTAEFAVGWTVNSNSTSMNERVGEYFGPVYESVRVVAP